MLKIFFKISSISDAIPNKSLPKSEELERILFRILVKDYVVTAYLSDRLFLATDHILLKISFKDFLRSRNQKTSV